MKRSYIATTLWWTGGVVAAIGVIAAWSVAGAQLDAGDSLWLLATLPGLGIAMAGLLLMAVAKALDLLAEIRDRAADSASIAREISERLAERN